ncbi:hypothetical protein F4Z98_13200 [Candidatus Poribacteria bacterium]|nr:hypothetical protein [Candidatus Poribacteria bacterium]MYC40210.1 hypothetical protein [Candidatus Dadabacteria bacterium]
MKKLTITLFGATGTRTLEITPRGGFPTRHVKAPRETGSPSLFEPETPQEVSPAADRTPKPDTPPTSTTEKSSVPSPAEAPPTLLEVIRFMHASDNHSGWLILDEILFVATTHYKMKFNQQTLLDALRELYTQGGLAYRLNGFDQHTFQLIENQEPSLKMLLAEVDTLMGKGGVA